MGSGLRVSGDKSKHKKTLTSRGTSDYQATGAILYGTGRKKVKQSQSSKSKAPTNTKEKEQTDIVMEIDSLVEVSDFHA